MSENILKLASEARRLLPVFGLLFIALGGLCLVGVFAETQISEVDETLPVAGSLSLSNLANGDLSKDFSNEVPALTHSSPNWSPGKSKIGFDVNGAEKK